MSFIPLNVHLKKKKKRSEKHQKKEEKKTKDKREMRRREAKTKISQRQNDIMLISREPIYKYMC